MKKFIFYIKEIKLFQKVAIYIVGFLIMSLGITIVIHAQIGYSPTDMFVVSINNLFMIDLYSYLLTGMNVIMFCLTLILYWILIKKKIIFKKKSDSIYYLTQLIPAFFGGVAIQLFKLWFVIDLQIEEYNYIIKLLFFLGGWVIFCLGTSIIVWVNILMQSYNSVVIDLSKLLNIKFMYARIIVDVTLSILGLIIVLTTNIGRTFEILNIGTVILTLFTGPCMHYLLKFWNKIYCFKNEKMPMEVK